MKILIKCQKLFRHLLQNVIFRIYFFSFFFFIISLNSFALSTDTLPEGIYSPSLRIGHIEGLEQRYNESGSLVKLSDYRSIEFDAKTLAQFNSQAKALITSLNSFGAFNLGDSLNLGTLEIETKPVIDYMVPLLAKGLSKAWTVGLGLPVVHYQNQVKLSQSLSNIEYYKSRFAGYSAELDQALNTNLGEATQQVLTNKGYKRLEDRDEQFLGDVQLASVFKFYEDTNQTMIHQATLSLPTGPKYDADDLLALNSFHKTSLENTFGYSRRLVNFWKVVPYTSVKFYLPDQIDARVPSSESDILPDQDSKETVLRTEGSTLEVGLQNILDVVDAVQLSFDYKVGAKSEDRYSGSKGQRYDLLSKNTSSRWQKVSAEVVYSTVKSYFKKKSSLPMTVSLNIFDTISGTNIERRTGQELSFTLFF